MFFPPRTIPPATLRRRVPWCAVLIMLIAAGCATVRRGSPLERGELPEDAPSPALILADLVKNDRAIVSFRAGGSFTLEWPEKGVKKVKAFRGGRVLFRRPADLYVQGNHRVTNMPLFKLISIGQEFLMEFPGSQENSFYELEGEEFTDVPFPVSPSDIAREMFLPETWGEITPSEFHLAGYHRDRQSYAVAVGRRDRPKRVIEVARVENALGAWVIIQNERRGEDGRVYAVTQLGDYHIVDGVAFPARVEAYFPTEDVRMIFELRNVRVNTPLSDSDFDLYGRARELGLLR